MLRGRVSPLQKIIFFQGEQHYSIFLLNFPKLCDLLFTVLAAFLPTLLVVIWQVTAVYSKGGGALQIIYPIKEVSFTAVL